MFIDVARKSMELGFGLVPKAIEAVKAGAMVSIESALAVFTAQSYLVLKEKLPIAEVGEYLKSWEGRL